MNQKVKIAFTGGGTGGHVMPIIAIGREIKKINPEFELHYVGPKNYCAELFKEGFISHPIISGKIRGYFSLLNAVDLLFKIPLSFAQSFFITLSVMPKLVFSKGGTGSLPVTFCAKILKIPVFIHESDSSPGKSNRITAKWAKKIFTSFEKTEYFNPQKIILAGNPIRKELLERKGEEAQKIFNLSFKKPVVLISGGSLGSTAINDAIFSVLNKLLENYEVIHISGPGNYKKMIVGLRAFLGKGLREHYHLYEFLNEVQLKNAYAVSDIIIGRAGASSIFETAALGKPSIIIPLPSSAHNHQLKNAYAYEKSGAAILKEQSNLGPNFFMGEIANVLSQKEKMKEAALRFAKPDAAEIIAKEIKEYLRSKI